MEKLNYLFIYLFLTLHVFHALKKETELLLSHASWPPLDDKDWGQVLEC